MEQTLLKLMSPTRTEIESVMTNPNLKISKMIFSLTDIEMRDIETQTERLNKFELGEKISKDPNNGKDKKEIIYQRINSLIKNIGILNQRYRKAKEAIKQVLNCTQFDISLHEDEFMKRIFPAIAKHLDNNDMLEFGQNHINTLTQDIGNAIMKICRKNNMITLTFEADNQRDLLEAEELVGI